MTFRTRFGAAALLLPALLAAACTLFPKSQPVRRHTYIVRPHLPGAAAPENPEPSRDPAPVTLLVDIPRARAGFDTPRMAYFTRPGEVSYYAYSDWADTPARMLAPLAVEALEKGGCCRAVVEMPNSAAGEVRLDIEDLALSQEFFTSPSRVRLSLRAVLVDLRTQRVLASRRFEAAEDAPSEDAAGGAAAADLASTGLLREISGWVAGAVAGFPASGTEAPSP